MPGGSQIQLTDSGRATLAWGLSFSSKPNVMPANTEMLWTISVLSEARKLYQKAGFHLVEEEQVHSFGKDLVSQTWVRDL
jgi:hypothetical protein